MGKREINRPQPAYAPVRFSPHVPRSTLYSITSIDFFAQHLLQSLLFGEINRLHML